MNKCLILWRNMVRNNFKINNVFIMKKYFYCCIFFILSAFAAQAQTDETGVLAAFKAVNEAMITYGRTHGRFLHR